MLSPVPPRDNSPAEKKRYRDELADKKKNPRKWGFVSNVPPAIRALGRKAVQTFSQAAETARQQVAGELDGLKADHAKLDAALAAKERAAVLLAAICEMLFRKEDLGKDGKPDVDRLKVLTGLDDVTAEERDALWGALEGGDLVETVILIGTEDTPSEPKQAAKQPAKRAAKTAGKGGKGK